MKSNSYPESLEARIAPAVLLDPSTVIYTDIDGDAVTVKASSGSFDLSQFTFAPFGMGELLVRLDLGADQAFRGADISITAQQISGDGFVSVNDLFASDIDLGKATVDGSLLRIRAGDINPATPGLAALRVQTLGAENVSLPINGESPTESEVNGALGALVVIGDVEGASVHVSGSIGRVQIGGSLLAGQAGGEIVASGPIGPVRIGGDIVGGGSSSIPVPGNPTPVDFFGGRIVSTGAGIDSVDVGGSIIGEVFRETGGIYAAGSVKSVRIGGDLSGGPNNPFSGLVKVGGDLDVLTIGGSIIGGSSIAGTIQQNGAVIVGGKLGKLRVGGDITGGDATNGSTLIESGSVTAQSIGVARVFGSVAAGDEVGGGTIRENGSFLVSKTINRLRIDGSLMGGIGARAGIYAGAFSGDGDGGKNVVLKRLIIGGDVENASIAAGVLPGSLLLANSEVQIGTVRVGGDWTGSDLSAGASRGADGDFGTEDDALLAGAPYRSGVISSIAKITIGGVVRGSLFDLDDSFGFVAERIGALRVNGAPIPLTGGNSTLDYFTVPGASDVFVREVGVPLLNSSVTA